MITEIATITIRLEDAAAFENAVERAASFFRSAEGCHGMSLERCIEEPTRYRLLVQWESVDHHMVTFRNSEAYQGWRALVEPFFASPPYAEHSEMAGNYF